MVTCPQCNHSNDPTAAFCDQCGAPLAGARAAGSAASMGMAPAAPSFGGGNMCPSCGAAVIPGEAFCDNCGAALNSVTPVPAVSSSAPYNPPPANPYSSAPPPVPVAPSPPPPIPAMPAYLLAANGQTYQLSGKSVYAIGREDAVSGINPDVDTTTSGGFEGGVGRRHAEIAQQGAQWLLKDLNSVNGTWVNNQKLAANAAQPLRPGDQIRLGKWTATFQQ
jgi:hypothetical protein